MSDYFIWPSTGDATALNTAFFNTYVCVDGVYQHPYDENTTAYLNIEWLPWKVNGLMITAAQDTNFPAYDLLNAVLATKKTHEEALAAGWPV